MNRRNFLKSLAAVALAPLVARRLPSKVYASDGITLVGWKQPNGSLTADRDGRQPLDMPKPLSDSCRIALEMKARNTALYEQQINEAIRQLQRSLLSALENTRAESRLILQWKILP